MADRVRIGINGFGRIGRCTLKLMVSRPDVEVVAVNDLADPDDLAYLLKYDSVHGWYPRRVKQEGGRLWVDDHHISFFQQPDPAQIPWRSAGADIVIEATGAFRPRDKAARHLQGGARRVIVSAPSDDADGTFVVGVNDEAYDPVKHTVVSAASCTTNCLAPVARVLHDTFGVELLTITTAHAYTSSQSLMDTPTRKRRRGRAAALSIVPTSTGATHATGLVIPELAGRMDGLALRVPVADGSITDIVAILARPADAAGVNEALRRAAEIPPLKGILRVSDEALVSRDVVGDPHSSIVDAESTRVLAGRLAKLLVWYDNEWGYSARLVDLARRMGAAGA